MEIPAYTLWFDESTVRARTQWSKPAMLRMHSRLSADKIYNQTANVDDDLGEISPSSKHYLN
jgi:hypothetical protein